MHMRNTGILPVAVLSGLCLAASLGCGGKAHYSVPDVANYNPAQGPVGTTVVISGADFSGVSVISFGGQPSQAYQVNNQSMITATVPPTAATGPVTVENPAGIGTSYSSFIVTPTVTAISPASGPSNTAVTVAGAASVVATTDAPWLRANAHRAGDRLAVRIWVEPYALAAGDYRGEVQLRDPNGYEGRVAVSLAVTALAGSQ